MIEFLADKMYELITTKGIEVIEQLKSQYNNQVILYGIIKRFAEGDYFKQEYSNSLTYIDQKDIILSISDDKLLPTLGVEKISQNIHNIILHMFVGDDVCVNKIEKIIATEYLSKRELTVKLIDLVTEEKKHTNKILDEIGEVKHAVEKINSINEYKKYREQQVLKCGLGRKIDLFIGEAAKYYLYWVNKGNVKSKGNEIPVTIQYFNQIEELVKSNFISITKDFYKQPVKIQIIDRVPFEIREVKAIDYMIYVHRIMENKSQELLRMSEYLPDEFIFNMIEYLDLFERNPMYDVSSRRFAEMFINATPSNEADFKKEIINELLAFGNIILKFKPMYKVYLGTDKERNILIHHNGESWIGEWW